MYLLKAPARECTTSIEFSRIYRHEMVEGPMLIECISNGNASGEQDNDHDCDQVFSRKGYRFHCNSISPQGLTKADSLA